jgi:hypothetical protein
MAVSEEFFRFLGYRWDVTAAKEIAAALPVQRFDPRSWAKLLRCVRIDREHVPYADLSRPVIVARVREMDGAPMVIDGWHRIARAQAEGVTALPCVVLTEEQEYRVRLFGGTKRSSSAGKRDTVRPQAEAAVLHEVFDHFTASGGAQRRSSGLDVQEARQARDVVAVRGRESGTGQLFAAVITAVVLTAEDLFARSETDAD